MHCEPTPALFEGNAWLELYRRYPDPRFAPIDLHVAGQPVAMFQGKVPLSAWLDVPFPLPSIPIAFLGSPVTDLFPSTPANDPGTAFDLIDAAEQVAVRNGAWALIVKDLPAGHLLEQTLAHAGFVSVAHEPIWYCEVPASLDAYFAGLRKGKTRRSLKGHLRKFMRDVRVRPARESDLAFIKSAYDTVWKRADMRLEQLTQDFFRATLFHPSCRLLVFERAGEPFAFQLLWQKDDVWFDKYIGTDASVYREYSFFSMRVLYLLASAPAEGIRWYGAGQGSATEKSVLGFTPIDVNLWIKPLTLRNLAPLLMKRFTQRHSDRVFDESEHE